MGKKKRIYDYDGVNIANAAADNSQKIAKIKGLNSSVGSAQHTAVVAAAAKSVDNNTKNNKNISDTENAIKRNGNNSTNGMAESPLLNEDNSDSDNNINIIEQQISQTEKQIKALNRETESVITLASIEKQLNKECKKSNDEEASNNEQNKELTNDFKLRVVPLEKLLATPKNTKNTISSFPTTEKRGLRQRNNLSIIELSDSSSDSEVEEIEIPLPKRRKSNHKVVAQNIETQDNVLTIRSSSSSRRSSKSSTTTSINRNSNKDSSIDHQLKLKVADKNGKTSKRIKNNILRIRSNSSGSDKSTSTTNTSNSSKDSSIDSPIVSPINSNQRNSRTRGGRFGQNRNRRASSGSDFEKPRNSRIKTRLLTTDSHTSSKSEQETTKINNSNNNKKKSTAGGSSDKTSKTSSSDPNNFIIRRFCVRIRRVSLSNIQRSRHKNMESVAAASSTSTAASTRRNRNVKEKIEEEESDYDENVQEDDGEEEEEEEEQADLSASSNNDDEVNSSDSEVMPQRKMRSSGNIKGKRGKAKSSDESDFEPDDKKKRRRIIKKNSSDSDDDDDKNKTKRKHIRKIIKTKDLDVSTKEAARQEEDRRKRIEERQRVYNQIFEKPENVEITDLVLDFNDESKKTLLEVDKKLLKKLKPHQVAGVKFMWDACFETLKDAEEKAGSGCILAHCMGLGKTLQVVTLSHTLLSNSRRTNVDRVLIISPLSTLNNWAREFVHWMGFAQKKDIEVYDISRYKDKPTRIFKLYEWCQEGGVCILGYDMYRILANEKAKGLRKKQREQLQEALVDPGPDLVVCDEGHLLKNEKTSISKAVTKMRTRRRIVLTGTPLQNNLKEYYCMIQFIKPNLLGTYKEYMNRFVNPITNGQYMDSTERDLRLMKHRSHILHKLLEGCIQRRDYSVLAPYLPPKHEYVVYTNLADLQQELYEFYMTTQRDLTSSDMSGKGARLFQDFQDLRRIWTHPMNLRVNSDTVIAKRLQKDDESDLEGFVCDDTESEATIGSSSESIESFKSDMSGGVAGGAASGSKVKGRKTRNVMRNGDGSDLEDGLSLGELNPSHDPSEWWRRFVEDKELNNINHSPKLVILMRLLQQCEAIGDKLLVFSQSLQSLDVIEHFLSLINSSTLHYEYEGDVGNFKGVWEPGLDYFRLDGSCSVEQRESMCKKFNNVSNLRARLFLISTRAGGLGINLVAANRVVIFDVSWNPSHDTQSIFRVYRFGQTKPCYIYRLIAMGTMEQKVYERQVAKQATAKRVIDEQQISRHYNQTDLMELYTYELKPSAVREVPILPKDRLFAELLSEHENLIFKYHEHDSLLEQEESETLNESERKAAWEEYEAEKTRTVQTQQYISYDRGAFGSIVSGQFGNASGSVTSNKIFGFRSDILLQLLNMKISKDFPDMNQNQVIQLVPNYLQTLYTQMNNGDPAMYKDLLELHQTIVHPSGMYMNPLLYANQNPSAAGYFQGAAAGQPGPSGAVVPAAAPAPNPPGFEADKVYEIE